MKKEFKVGDWVRMFDGLNSTICKLDDEKLYLVNQLYKNSTKHWKPKEGEWCWFSYRGINCHLAKFVDKKYGFFNAIPANEKFELAYDKAEPFIGELPTIIKG